MRPLHLLLVLASCAPSATSSAPAGREPPEAGLTVCFACQQDAGVVAQVRSTLIGTCASGGVELSCHSTGAGGLTLGTMDDLAQIIDVPSVERPDLVRVAPGSPATSYLFLKLVGDGGIEGGPMPGGTPDPRLIELFGGWIEAGAPDR